MNFGFGINEEYYMKLQLFLLLCFLSWGSAQAQFFYPVSTKGADQAPETCTDPQNAGMVLSVDALPNTQSDSVAGMNIRSQVTFLCYQDSVFIDHEGIFDLDGDPDPSTRPEIGYAVYRQPPVVFGTTLDDVIADPGILFQNNNIFIVRGGNPDPDTYFFNDGSVNQIFGNGGPTLLYFAPITYDAYMGRPVYEDGGPCVDVNITNFFPVVYLNEITPERQIINGLSGNLILNGGYPEWDNSASYRILDVSMIDDPAIQGTIQTGTATFGNALQFTVPQAGVYNVTVTDDNGCAQNIEMDFSTESILFELDKIEAEPGDTICLPLRVYNFDSITTFGLAINYNGQVLEYLGDQNPAIDDLIANGRTDSEIRLIWETDDFIAGRSLNNGAVLVELCFRVLPTAQIGDRSDLIFVEKGLTEVRDIADNVFKINYTNGCVLVNSTDFTYSVDYCNPLPGTSNGSITISVFNGTPPYTVVGPSTNVIGASGESTTYQGLGAGTYNFSITDDAGNSIAGGVSVTLSEDPDARPNFILDALLPLCPDNATGQISIDSLTGNDPFFIQWSNGEINTNQISRLPNGNYFATVSDENGCSTTKSILLNTTRIEADIVITNASCQDASNGQVTITPSGGTPEPGVGYEYEMDGFILQFGNSTTFNSLAPGDYSIEVQDDFNCSETFEFTIGVENEISLENLSIIGASCAGDDGQISFDAASTSGSSTFNIQLTHESGTPDITTNVVPFNQTGIEAGTYSLTIINDGCRFDTTLFVPAADSIQYDVTFSHLKCNGDPGSITIDTTGNGNPISISWDPNFLPDAFTVSLTTAGVYVFTLSDPVSGCTVRDSVEILPNVSPLFIYDQDNDLNDPSCPGACDGSVRFTFDPNGGSPITTLETRDSIYTVTSNPFELDGFCDGDQLGVVGIRNEAGCFTNASSIPGAGLLVRFDADYDSIRVVDTIVTNPVCPGRSDGSIELQVRRGNPPYIYSYLGRRDTSGALSFRIENLSAGTYPITIEDNCGFVNLEITVEEPDWDPGIRIDQSPSCFNTCDAEVTAIPTVDGIGANFDFEWSTGDVTRGASQSSASGFCPGMQWVAISNGRCIDTFEFLVEAPDSIRFDVIPTQPACFGESSGQIEVLTIGGTSPYTYEWIGFADTDSLIENIPVGTYTLMVTDANGCSRTSDIELDQPDSLQAFFDPVNIMDPSCPNTEDGMLAVTVLGGSPNYTFNWTPNVSSDDIADNIQAGTYTVEVVDANGCQASASATLGTVDPIQVFLPAPDTPSCPGGLIEYVLNQGDVIGGNGGPYRYSLNGSASVELGNALTAPAGIVDLVITDADGCPLDTSLFVPFQDGFSVELPEDVEIKLGETFTIVAEVFSLTPIQSQIWTPADRLSCDTCLITEAQPFQTTTYTLTVIDSSGCVLDESITITVDAERDVFIPNVFSPNGDNLNDIFRVYTGISAIGISSFEVFDRWGNQLFGAENLEASGQGSAGWDGTADGQMADPGVYPYSISVEFLDGRTINYKGTVTIVDPRK